MWCQKVVIWITAGKSNVHPSVGVVFKYYNFDPALKVKTTLLSWPYAESGVVPMYPSDNVSWIATTHFVSQLPQAPFAPWIRQNCYSLIQNTLSTATCQYVTHVWGIFERHLRQNVHLLQKGLRAFRRVIRSLLVLIIQLKNRTSSTYCQKIFWVMRLWLANSRW